MREWNTSTVASRRSCVCVHCSCKRTRKTIHSTQYNTSQSPPQLTTISLVLSIHTQYIIITLDNKITPIAVCAVQRRDEKFQRRPPINSDHYYHHNTRPGMNALLTRQIKSHIITKPDCAEETKFPNPTTTNQINHKRTTTSSFLAQGTNTIRA